MQTADKQKLLQATFIREMKNRFLCEVELNGEPAVCYVPSSCHLSNFIDLGGKQVLLVPTQAKDARTRFSLFAVPYKRSHILLNTSMANQAIQNDIHSRRFSYLGKRKTIIKEHYVSGYKSDLFILETKTVIEVKSVLSLTESALFPTVYSERSLKQLDKLKTMLGAGFRVCYMIVSLNPYVKSITILENTSFYAALKKCIDLGMQIAAYSCVFDGQKIKIKSALPIRVN